MKSYPPTWEGKLLLACWKCQKKLQGQPLAKLKKAIKRRNKQQVGGPFHLINVPCMDLCPKDAVTICFPAEGRLSILRSVAEIDELYR